MSQETAIMLDALPHNRRHFPELNARPIAVIVPPSWLKKEIANLTNAQAGYAIHWLRSNFPPTRGFHEGLSPNQWRRLIRKAKEQRP